MASLERQHSQQTRAHAISALKRSASKREPGQQRGPQNEEHPPQGGRAAALASSTGPRLERTNSEIARDEAMRRLEGTPSPQPPPSPAALLRSASTVSQRPPRLSAIQRRHLEQQQRALESPSNAGLTDPEEEGEENYDQDSPSFSIFTPSVLGPLPQGHHHHHQGEGLPTAPAFSPVEESPVTPSELQSPRPQPAADERQEVRSNLIRKLSQRDKSGGSMRKGSGRRAAPATPASGAASPTETVASEFKPYRYTMERDRDSVMAKLNQEDSFEYERLLQARRDEEREQSREEEDVQETLSAQHAWPLPAENYAFPSPTSSRPTSPLQPASTPPVSSSRGAAPLASEPMRRFASDTGPSQAPKAKHSSRRRSSHDEPHHTSLTSQARPSSRSTTENVGYSQSRSSQHSRSSRHRNGGSQDSKVEPDRQPSGNKQTYGHSRSQLSEASSLMDKSEPLVLHDSDHEVHPFESEDEEEPAFAPQLGRPMPSGPPPRDLILAKLEAVLSSAGPMSGKAAAGDGSAPYDMGDPSRKLLMHAPVLQVVNAHTVKDRYLFLFNDILIIAKPLILEDPATTLIVPPSLETKFLTKSIVELEKLKLQTQRDDLLAEGEEKKKHALLVSFVDRFANDPKKAIYTLVMKGGLANQPEVIANLLFRTPELNHSQLGTYLSKKENKHVMKAFIERFRFFGVRLEDSLRCLLATIRLPNDAAAAEYLLTVFANVWTALNGHALGWDAALTLRLVISIMELNDYLHSGIDDESTAMGHLFGFPNPAITVSDFVSAFKSKDPKRLVSEEVLSRVYTSIKRERLQQAADNSIMAVTPEIPVTVRPGRLPSRLTYQQPSEEIIVSIPKPDAKFSIKLLGGDIRCEPSVLRFDKSNEARFRISATALGHRTLLFLRSGRNATFYTGLPVNKSFSVERAFMKHTFQLSFVNHLGVKRKYMFSLSDGHLRTEWLQDLRAGIDACAASVSYHQPNVSRARQVASSVSLQVLRDSLIQPDEPRTALTSSGSRPSSASRNTQANAAKQRSNSFSKTYFVGMGRAETDLNQNPKGTPNPSSQATWDRRPSAANVKQAATQLQQQQEEANSERVKTGHEVALTAIQNSHLPTVLGFLSSTVSAAPHPLDRNSSAFRPVPEPWAPST